MIDSLLDTSIIVDLLRAFAPAQQWVSAGGNHGVTATVWLEVLDGAQNARNAQQAVKMLEKFTRIDPTTDDYDQAIRLSLHYRLSHGAQSSDCLIAAVALRIQRPLFTANLKHFAPMLGAGAQRPY
jgi:predicted nucleic acid-binding protein